MTEPSMTLMQHEDFCIENRESFLKINVLGCLQKTFIFAKLDIVCHKSTAASPTLHPNNRGGTLVNWARFYYAVIYIVEIGSLIKMLILTILLVIR